MTDSFIELGIQSGGDKVDAESLVVSSQNVLRQRGQISGASALEVARVFNGALAESAYGLGVRKLPGRSGVTSVFAAQVLNASTTANSSLIDCSPYAYANFFADIQRSNNPTFVEFEFEFSDDGGTDWFRVEELNRRFNDMSIITTSSPGLRRAWQIPIVGPDMRVALLGGTTGSDTITVTLTAELVQA